MTTLRTLLLASAVALSLFASPASTVAPVVDAVADDAAAPYTAPAIPVAVAPEQEVTADIRRARELLEEYQRTYRLLDGVTVEGGETPEGHQAVAYYRTGRIVISPERYVSIERIMAHEIWHIIDWRDNGRIDWGEDVPPADAADFLREGS